MNLFTELLPIKKYTGNNIWDIQGYELFPSTNEDISEPCLIICENCFWCASLFNPGRSYPECPGCHKRNLETMPIAMDENFRSHQMPTRQVEMEFSG